MKRFFYLFILTTLFSSCLTTSVMFKTDKNYKFNQTPDYKKIPEYKISPNDILVFDIFTNNGFSLININTFHATTNGGGGGSGGIGMNGFGISGGGVSGIGSISSSGGGGMGLTGFGSSGSGKESPDPQLPDQPTYLVDPDGFVKLPLLGKLSVTGLTIREVETLLEKRYSEFYLNPFIVANIVNRRVIYFTGNISEAKVIPLSNNNTTVLQLIAKEGGMSIYGKAQNVKLIRKINGKDEVYLMDLSTIKGLGDAQIVLQTNDILYVEPRNRSNSRVRQEIYPLLSIFTSSLLIILTIDKLASP